MTCLLDLPYEVIHGILTHVEPHDLAAVSKTCQDLSTFVTDDELLHKKLYLFNWDDPSQCHHDPDIAWKDQLQQIVRFEKLLHAKDQDLKKSNLDFLTTTTVSLLKSVPKGSSASQNIKRLQEIYQMPANVHDLICGSTLFALANGNPIPRSRTGSTKAEDLAQLSAKLHCLFGISVHITGELEPISIHPYARARVYDLRRYTRDTFWGPFKDDGSVDVDWEKMEAIMIVLDYNHLKFCHRTQSPLEPSWKTPFHGASPYSYVPAKHVGYAVEEPTELELKDPYNITGTWMRIVCFLDYSDLFEYNFAYAPPEGNQDRQPLSTEEATRMIIMKLKLTALTSPEKDDGQALPVAHFEGTSRALDSPWDPNANSGIRGTVRLTKEGEVRWTTFSIFQGEERWRSEGIQIGGPGSARGVLGNWFDKNYDQHGPAGPTAFWKMHDGIGKGRCPMMKH